MNSVAGADAGGTASRHARSWKLAAVVALCVAPVIVSYLMYYVFPPAKKSNYGQLIEPQVTLPVLDPGDAFGSHKGQWVLVVVQSGACDEACARKLYFVRQTHASLGRDRDRVDMVLLKPDTEPLSAALKAAHPRLAVHALPKAAIDRWFRAPDAAPGSGAAEDRVFVVDPQHNLMLVFPPDPEPSRTLKDLQRLLKASRIG